ncbi:MAG: transporter [Novosphingobium sp.]|nr:transporter [Novosphingobium sp.]
MKITVSGGALALPLLLCAVSAPAHASEADSEILTIGQRPDGHGPAGTMGDHVHKSGDLMLGMIWTREEYGGGSRRGTSAISPEDVAAAGYTVRDKSMTMDMAMLHIMWAPSDRVTLMVMPMWMRMSMTMEGLPGGMGGGHEGHGDSHSMMPGETMSHSVEGMGDTQFGALVALSRNPRLSAHAGLMVSAPTGKVDRKSADGKFVHYMMQGGSGTWDIIPSFTIRGASTRIGWGAQASYVFRTQNANESGFRFGDRFNATAWLSAPVTPRLSLSARMNYTDEGRIGGHYNGPHNHAAPPDRQENYGGQRLEAGAGANLVVGRHLRLGAEALLPVYQKLNGIQLRKRFGANVNASTTF